ncbi:hypothetical protein Tco_1132082 [Tanacetum coccineum]|uniref:Uncharacterized protein n=1 Tax=Tanacetum coccineum TaxID=301880 RepID=A0ABQ5JAW9_9ASTR
MTLVIGLIAQRVCIWVKTVQMRMVGANGGNQFRQYAGQNVGYQNEYNAVQNVGNQVVQDAVQNQGVQNIGNQNGQIGAQNIGNGNVVAARAEGNAPGNNGNQIRCYNCRGLGQLCLGAVLFDQGDRDAAYLQTQLAVVSQDIMSIVQNPSVVDSSNLQTELDRTKERLENCIIKKENEYAKLWNDWYDTNTKFANQKVDETNDLSKPVTSNSVPTPQESKSVKHDNVIAPGMFRINPLKPSREEKYVPNKVRASVRTTPITVSQPHVVTKKDVNSDSNGLSSTGVDNTAKTRRPQPRSNTKNDRVPSASKSSCNKNKEVEVEEHHRNLLLSKNKKHMSSECKHVKLDIRNDKSEVVCAMCLTIEGKKIMETMNVTFDELSAMAFEQSSSKPGLKHDLLGQISSGTRSYLCSVKQITTQKLTKRELDLLFEAMYDDYFGSTVLLLQELLELKHIKLSRLQHRATTKQQTTAPTQQIHPLKLQIVTFLQDVVELETQLTWSASTATL